MGKVLLEFSAPQCQIIREEVDEKTNERVMWVAVKWQHAEIVNGNKRRYSRAILQREMERLQPQLSKGAVYGASYHPKDDAEVPDISHIWESYKMEDDGSCVGVIKVLPTDQGRNAQVIIKHGGHIGMSSRGFGTTTRREVEVEGKKITVEDINEDFRLKSPGDFVLTPSVPDAGVQRMIESRLSEAEDSTSIKESNMYENIEALRAAFPELFKSLDEELNALKEKVLLLETEANHYLDAVRGIITTLAELKGVIPEDAPVAEEQPAAEVPAVEVPVEIPAVEVPVEIPAVEVPVAEIPVEVPAVEVPAEAPAEAIVASAEVEQLRAENVALKAADAKRLADVAVVAAIDKATEKDTAEYQKLIKSELVKDGIPVVEKVEDVEAKVADTRKKIADLKTAAVKEKITKSGLGSKGVIPNPEGSSSKFTESQIYSRWQEAMKAGYKGDLDKYSKDVLGL